MTLTRRSDVDTIEAVWAEHLAVAQTLSQITADVAAAAERIAGSLAAGGLLLVAGNGGSAADAQHIAAELTGRFLKERAPLRAMALHANTSALTAIGNDYGFDKVFAREVQAHGRPGDVLLGLSTSGNSANILAAFAAARERRLSIIALTGASGGAMRAQSDLCIRVPSTSTPRIQEMHITIGHTLCQLIESRLCE